MPWQMNDCAPIFSSMSSLIEVARAVDTRAAVNDQQQNPPFANPPPGMSISVLPTGVIESRAALAFEGGSFNDMRRFALNAVLVRHPRGDLLLDTGIGRQWQTHRSALPWVMRKTTKVVAGQPAVDQLTKHGYDAAKLAGIVLTHTHWDHISGVQDFPGVPVWLTQEEQQFIASGHRSTKVARKIAPINLYVYPMTDRTYLGFPRSLDMWSDGSVVLVPAPGHTPGSVMVFITLASGLRYALIGDIVWQMEGIEREAEKPWLSRMMADNSPRYVLALIVSLTRLHNLYPKITLIPSHDERAMATIPLWPNCVM
jgi:N-acyl homoserine lactone hydrolase